MSSIVGEHVDPRTGEINLTSLAEDTCEDLNLWEADGCTIPEDLFDLAVEVAGDWEAQFK